MKYNLDVFDIVIPYFVGVFTHFIGGDQWHIVLSAICSVLMYEFFKWEKKK
jgi:K+-sensing histidine kinase KdpD